MKHRLHVRIVVWNFALIALGVMVLDSILNSSLRSHLERDTEQRLVRESSVADALLPPVLDTTSADAAADRLGKMLDVRVTVIAPDGRVLGDSELDGEALTRVENHGNRPEVLQAAAQGTGTDVRSSATLHLNYMYFARKLDRGFVRLAIPLVQIDRLLGQLRMRLLYASLIALALSVVFSYLASIKITRPIRELAIAAKELETGDLRRKLPVRGTDEISALASALNTIAENLKRKIEELEESHRRLEHDFAAMQRIETMRRDFVANVSHEFKTPLTSIRGYTETLLSGAGDHPKVRNDFLQVIERNAAQLEALVRDLLTLAKLEAELPATREIVEMSALIEECLWAREAALEQRAIHVEVQCPNLKIAADRSRLVAAVSNLIDNAIQYNRQGGEIRIRGTREHSGGISIEFADTGIGIPTEALPRIFERFYRVDKARSRDSGGTGLGLSIARHAIESQGGKIFAESRPGEGSTFRIILNAK